MDLEKIRAAAERVARSEGLEVVDVEWKVGKQRFLRVTIDRLAHENGGEQRGSEAGRQGGISHHDCEVVSNQLSVILDVEELVPGPRYILEVSSPGLDRKLLKPTDYERFAGRRAKIWMAEPIEVRPIEPQNGGSQEGMRTGKTGAPTSGKFFEGRLAGYADGMVKMEVQGRLLALPFAGIRKANLVVEF